MESVNNLIRITLMDSVEQKKRDLEALELEELLELCKNTGFFTIPRRGKSSNFMYKKRIISELLKCHNARVSNWQWKSKKYGTKEVIKNPYSCVIDIGK